MKSQSYCFFPKIFDSDTAQPNVRTTVLVFRLLFAFVLFFRLLKLVFVDLYKMLKTFIQTHKLDITLSFIFSAGVLVLVTFVLILSFVYNLQMQGKVDTFSVITEKQFNDYKQYALTTSAFLKLISVMIFIVILETLLLLNTQFPTFGVLFYTVGRSKNKILLFLLV
jgi:hypothetical protein